jgi:glycosyltransferase involved in cell wall biosynthesis
VIQRVVTLARNIHCEIGKSISLIPKSLKIVDVLIPTRGANNTYLSRSISTFLSNIFVKSIIIVVDSDNDLIYQNVLNKFSKNRKIQVYKSPGRGISRTLNYGISKSNAKYIARQDDDDMSSFFRIYIQLLYMFITRSDLVFTNMQKIDSGGKRLVHLEYCRPLGRVYPVGMLIGCLVSHATLLGKRSIFDKYNFTNDILAEDYDLWMRIVNKYRIANISLKLYKFRIHSEQITKKNSAITQHDHLYEVWRNLATEIGIPPIILSKDIFLTPYSKGTSKGEIEQLNLDLFSAQIIQELRKLPNRFFKYYKSVFEDIYR